MIPEVHACSGYLLDNGHFALEDKLPEIAPLIADFLDHTRA